MVWIFIRLLLGYELSGFSLLTLTILLLLFFFSPSRQTNAVTESKRHDRAVAAMANELRQLVDTANAPIFGIGEFGAGPFQLTNSYMKCPSSIG